MWWERSNRSSVRFARLLKGMGRLTSGETCVRGIGETPKVQGHVRSSLVRGGGDHTKTVCGGGGVGDENGVLF